MATRKITLIPVIAVLALQIINTQANQPVNIQRLSAGYEAKSRLEYSQNDVGSFIYQWFAAFDHQQEPGYFLQRLAEPVDLRYPGAALHSRTDFLRWYRELMENIVWNEHTVSNLVVSGNQNNGWKASYDITRSARDSAGNVFNIRSHQEMDMIRCGSSLKITRLRACKTSQHH
ncbi:hypothetical protein [Spongorhabdus nitratireducens]